jgi:hypothetical protein
MNSIFFHKNFDLHGFNGKLGKTKKIFQKYSYL